MNKNTKIKQNKIAPIVSLTEIIKIYLLLNKRFFKIKNIIKQVIYRHRRSLIFFTIIFKRSFNIINVLIEKSKKKKIKKRE